jgi:hypothetical protein
MSSLHQQILHPPRTPPRQSPAMQTRSSVARSTFSPEAQRSGRRPTRESADRTVSPDAVRNVKTRRSSRAMSTLIDLTESSPVVGDDGFPAAKRRKVSQPSAAPAATTAEVDLVEDDERNELSLKKSREELLRIQDGDNHGQRRKLAGFSCVICMEDEPTDLAVTPCGMLPWPA